MKVEVFSLVEKLKRSTVQIDRTISLSSTDYDNHNHNLEIRHYDSSPTILFDGHKIPNDYAVEIVETIATIKTNIKTCIFDDTTNVKSDFLQDIRNDLEETCSSLIDNDINSYNLTEEGLLSHDSLNLLYTKGEYCSVDPVNGAISREHTSYLSQYKKEHATIKSLILPFIRLKTKHLNDLIKFTEREIDKQENRKADINSAEKNNPTLLWKEDSQIFFALFSALIEKGLITTLKGKSSVKAIADGLESLFEVRDSKNNSIGLYQQLKSSDRLNRAKDFSEYSKLERELLSILSKFKKQ